jgi:AcrB/AcrD/AcrF family
MHDRLPARLTALNEPLRDRCAISAVADAISTLASSPCNGGSDHFRPHRGYSRLSEVEFTLVLTIRIVVLVVLLFLRNLWATVIPGITIPLALLGSLGVMYVLNFSLNNLSLMALTIAIGFVGR